MLLAISQMIKGEYKKILWEVFDVLDFFDHEKGKALEAFKRKFANQLLLEIKDSLSDEQRRWIDEAAEKKYYDKEDLRIGEIQKTIDFFYSKDKMDEVSTRVFKKILISYVDFMTQRVDAQRVEKINKIVSSF